MDKQLTDDSFQVVINNTTDITETFELDLGGIREDVCQASEDTVPFLSKIRELMTQQQISIDKPSSEIQWGLIQMREWASSHIHKVQEALIEGKVAAIDATPVIEHRRYLTTQLYACAVGVLTSKEPLDLSVRLTKTKASVKYEGSLENIQELMQQSDILTGSQSWPSAYMEYQLFYQAMNHRSDYIVIDGNLITQNLLTRRQGRDLFRKILIKKNKKYVGVIKDITRSQSELRMYARALNSGEMYIQGSLLDCMRDRLEAYTGDTEKFLKSIGKDILRGVFKPGVKTFGFECHRDDLPEIIALLWLEKDGQPGHEIPFLLNQVDAKLRGRYRPSEVSALVDAALVQNFDEDIFFDEMQERSFR